MAKNNLKEKLFKQLAEEYGTTTDEIRSIVESQFIFLRKTLEAGAFDSVRIPLFGRFHVNPYRLNKLNLARVKKNKKK
jgi:nucleoid DNA-binding protein